jgi:hypothetical protein
MVERGRSFHQDRHVPLLADLVEALPEQAAAAVGSHASEIDRTCYCF